MKSLSSLEIPVYESEITSEVMFFVIFVSDLSKTYSSPFRGTSYI